jgi:hypothetical protein
MRMKSLHNLHLDVNLRKTSSGIPMQQNNANVKDNSQPKEEDNSTAQSEDGRSNHSSVTRNHYHHHHH